MKNSKEILSSVLKTTQMGQVGIRSVMNFASKSELKKELASQLREYDSIEQQAHALASQRGWDLKELQPAARSMSEMMAHMQLKFGRSDSKIAGMMIQGNTKGMIKSLKNLHQYSDNDSQISALSQKLLDLETDNIRQMQPYL